MLTHSPNPTNTPRVEPIEAKGRPKRHFCAALFSVAALVTASLQPARPHLLLVIRRELHWIAFAGVTLLLLFAFRRRGARQIVLWAVSLAAAIEYLQHHVYRHPMEWLDVADDALAILAAIGLDNLAAPLRRTISPDSGPDIAA